jgi:hypothetical protein
MIKLIFCVILMITSSKLMAQLGGTTIFNALNLPTNARSSALGVDFISVKDGDINLGLNNPALYNVLMHKKASFSQGFQAGGFSYSTLQYGQAAKHGLFWSGNIRSANYGKMNQTDKYGATIGTMNPADFIFGFGLSKSINPVLSVGTNLNFINSNYAGFTSNGLSLDLAGCLHLEEQRITFTALIKNVGFEMNKFVNSSKTRENLPAELQLGISHKLKHAPLRFSLTGHNLQKWNLSYNDPNAKPTIDAITGDTTAVKIAGFGEKLFRHFIFTTEILISKNLHLRAAYDYNRRKNMKVDARGGIAGLSMGIGFTFKRFTLDYGLFAYSVAGYSNMVSFTMNLDKWRRKGTREITPISTPPPKDMVPPADGF